MRVQQLSLCCGWQWRTQFGRKRGTWETAGPSPLLLGPGSETKTRSELMTWRTSTAEQLPSKFDPAENRWSQPLMAGGTHKSYWCSCHRRLYTTLTTNQLSYYKILKFPQQLFKPNQQDGLIGKSNAEILKWCKKKGYFYMLWSQAIAILVAYLF